MQYIMYIKNGLAESIRTPKTAHPPKEPLNKSSAAEQRVFCSDVTIQSPVSLRTSAHTGVAIPRFFGCIPNFLQKEIVATE